MAAWTHRIKTGMHANNHLIPIYSPLTHLCCYQEPCLRDCWTMVTIMLYIETR